MIITSDNQAEQETVEAIKSIQTGVILTQVLPTAASKQILLPNHFHTHQPSAGLNPVVDAAAYLFSILNKLKNLKSYSNLNKLQNELITEITVFQDVIKNHGYAADYIIICRYILCATFDELISETSWGNHWQPLLAVFKQENQHKFFAILERSIKDPVNYIDLLELIYLCLNAGYRGQFRGSDHNHFQLEQITNNLYQHIRSQRGNFSKNLSTTSLKPTKYTAVLAKHKTSLTWIFILTACIIMTIFISLGYLMDVISNETYKNIATLKIPSTTSVTKL